MLREFSLGCSLLFVAVFKFKLGISLIIIISATTPHRGELLTHSPTLLHSSFQISEFSQQPRNCCAGATLEDTNIHTVRTHSADTYSCTALSATALACLSRNGRLVRQVDGVGNKHVVVGHILRQSHLQWCHVTSRPLGRCGV